MTTQEVPLAVLRLYQHQVGTGSKQVADRKPQVRPCGDEENRTLNPRLAKAVLCQLSYVPGGWVWVAQGADGVLTA